MHVDCCTFYAARHVVCCTHARYHSARPSRSTRSRSKSAAHSCSPSSPSSRLIGEESTWRLLSAPPSEEADGSFRRSRRRCTGPVVRQLSHLDCRRHYRSGQRLKAAAQIHSHASCAHAILCTGVTPFGMRITACFRRQPRRDWRVRAALLDGPLAQRHKRACHDT